MGQYYFGVIREKNSREVIAAEYACKLHESSRGDLLYMAYALSRNGIGYMQRVCWAGDYSDIKDAKGKNLYDRIHDHKDDMPEWVPEIEKMSPYKRKFSSEAVRQKAIDKFRSQRHQFWLANIAKDEEGHVRDELRFICNHDRREYFDMNKLVFEKWGYDNPLAVLTSDPTCRISGGGDYCYQDNYKMYAAWYDCVLSAEPEVPEGYQEINANFGTKVPIWNYDGLLRSLYGEKNDAPYPHYSDFHTFLYRGRFEEYKNSLCIMPKEELKAMYCDWYKSLELDRVFKAYDAVSRVLKHDPYLRGELPKGMTFKVTEYDLHYLCIDGVEVCVYQGKDDIWHTLRERADYNDMQYDCSRKARSFHRRRLECINSGFFELAA